MTIRDDSAPTSDIWLALVEGRVRLVPNDSNGTYRLVPNPPSVRATRALTGAEVDTLARIATAGIPKSAAVDLGITSSGMSYRLACIARKLGTSSRSDVIRIAVMLLSKPARTGQGVLTAAEHEILALVVRGLSNAEIARARGRSVRTVANQVAMLLRKQGASSRRHLVGRGGLE